MLDSVQIGIHGVAQEDMEFEKLMKRTTLYGIYLYQRIREIKRSSFNVDATSLQIMLLY